MIFKRPKSKINKALDELKVNSKCQINILNNDIVVSQVFRASNFSSKYEFPDTYDIAILSRKEPPNHLKKELQLLFFKTEYNRVVIFCNQNKIDVEHLILSMIKEDMNLTNETLPLDIQLMSY